MALQADEGLGLIIVRYRKRFLEKCYKQKAEAIKRWGPIVGEKYIKHLNLIYAAEKTDDLYHLPQLGFHPLKGDREGQHSIILTRRARLIVKCEADTIIIVEEVSADHYEQ